MSLSNRTGQLSEFSVCLSVCLSVSLSLSLSFSLSVLPLSLKIRTVLVDCGHNYPIRVRFTQISPVMVKRLPSFIFADTYCFRLTFSFARISGADSAKHTVYTEKACFIAAVKPVKYTDRTTYQPSS